MQWDIFCKVVDNHGDLGVCWRLSADLASRGENVRLWVDDPLALHWMAPDHSLNGHGVKVLHWVEPLPDVQPGDVVVETFGCDPPAYFVERMAGRPPVWINLEYLSAEDYVERSHGLPSPQPTGWGGTTKWFFFPGFTPATGGLLREAHSQVAGEPPWAELDVWPRPGERCVSLFAYADAPFAELFDLLDAPDQGPTLLLICAGASQAPALAALEGRPQRGLRAHALPWLTQRAYDRLLHACDLNFARGEDSIVRAMWAGAPFVWHIYKQDDGVHERKLKAMLNRMQADPAVRRLWRAWNGLDPWPAALPDAAAWREACQQWRAGLQRQGDLTSQLLGFVASKR